VHNTDVVRRRPEQLGDSIAELVNALRAGVHGVLAVDHIRNGEYRNYYKSMYGSELKAV